MDTHILRAVNGSISYLPRGGGRDRRRATVRPDEPAAWSDRRPVGRAWINGREVGGTAIRLAHLVGGHD